MAMTLLHNHLPQIPSFSIACLAAVESLEFEPDPKRSARRPANMFSAF
jgi:hypothetical protein